MLTLHKNKEEFLENLISETLLEYDYNIIHMSVSDKALEMTFSVEGNKFEIKMTEGQDD